MECQSIGPVGFLGGGNCQCGPRHELFYLLPAEWFLQTLSSEPLDIGGVKVALVMGIELVKGLL